MFRPMWSSPSVKIFGDEAAVVCFVACVVQVSSMRMCVWVGGLHSVLLCVVLRVLFSNACSSWHTAEALLWRPWIKPLFTYEGWLDLKLIYRLVCVNYLWTFWWSEYPQNESHSLVLFPQWTGWKALNYWGSWGNSVTALGHDARSQMCHQHTEPIATVCVVPSQESASQNAQSRCC
jgi:hypothetical protein